MRRPIIYSVLSLSLALISQSNFAKANAPTECPSVEQLQSYQIEHAEPYRFDTQTGEALFSAGFSPVIEGWHVDIDGMRVHAGDDLEQVATDTLKTLHAVSTTPFVYSIFNFIHSGKQKNPNCIYTSSINERITAIAYYNHGPKEFNRAAHVSKRIKQ